MDTTGAAEGEYVLTGSVTGSRHHRTTFPMTGRLTGTATLIIGDAGDELGSATLELRADNPATTDVDETETDTDAATGGEINLVVTAIQLPGRQGQCHRQSRSTRSSLPTA